MSTTTVLVDDQTTLKALLDGLDGLDSLRKESAASPSLYLDLEGVELSRLGTVSIITLFAQPLNQVYLIDVYKLKTEALSTTNSNGTSLKSIFESPSIPKTFFDVRNDSDALHHHFGIKLQGIHDIQVMEVATRNGNKTFVNGLERCIKNEIAVPSTWYQVKALGKKLFDPNQGGSYDVFNERPLKSAIADYCAGDVVLLPRLWDTYNTKLERAQDANLQTKVERMTKDRVLESQSEYYNPKGRSKAISHWSEKTTNKGL
jgi:exonuclease 3'-5' domain-containing protein 1